MGRSDLVATARVAARQMKRHRGSTVLLALLVAAPVALATWSMSIFATLNPTAADQIAGQLGNADFRMFGSPLVVPENLPAGSVVEMVQSSPEPIDIGGQLISVNVRRLQTDAVLERSRSVLLSGRWPNTAGEAAVSPRIAKDLQLSEGAAIRVGDTDRTIVGIVRTPFNRNGYDVRVAEAPVDSQRSYSELLVRLPAGSSVEQVMASLTSGASESRVNFGQAERRARINRSQPPHAPQPSGHNHRCGGRHSEYRCRSRRHRSRRSSQRRQGPASTVRSVSRYALGSRHRRQPRRSPLHPQRSNHRPPASGLGCCQYRLSKVPAPRVPTRLDLVERAIRRVGRSRRR